MLSSLVPLLVLCHFSSLSDAFEVKSFNVSIPPTEVDRMKRLVGDSRLPSAGQFVGGGWDKGTQSSYLRDMQTLWSSSGYDWEQEQKAMNRYNQFTVELEGIDVHFVHQKSQAVNPVPLLMLHGWPGSFHEYLPTVDSLISASDSNVSFDVIIPSLPGYTFSAAPPINWSPQDTSRIFNNLMVNVLGYDKYMIYGNDLGCIIGYTLYAKYTSSVAAGMFSMIPFLPPTRQEIQEANITLTNFENTVVQNTEDWAATGNAYSMEFITKPNTVGLSLVDNPIGLLSWFAQIFHDVSDPRAGTGPSRLTNITILTSTSLYFLTESFFSAIWLYTFGGFMTDYDLTSKPTTPMGFSAFKYNVGWPKVYIGKVGNLTFYNEHDFGGHFPGLDNPEALVDDLRTMALGVF